MPPFPDLKVVGQFLVKPAATGSQATIPLTYFDLLFLHFSPVQRLFFYDLHVSIPQFQDSELPNLRQSLSAALRRFYPLAGELTFPGGGKPPEILCSDSDSVSLTAALSSDDFQELSADGPRAAERFRPFLPRLPAAALLSVQVTLFPKAGVAIGTTLHHAAADGSAYTHFMKTWALLSNIGESAALSLLPQPHLDRSVAVDEAELEPAFLKDGDDLEADGSLAAWDLSGRLDLVRATFVLGPEQIHRLARRTAARCSPYALACGLVWASVARARGPAKRERFGFVTGCRARVRPALPAAYFGNCLGICGVEMKGEELAGRRGAAAGAEAIWGVIKGLEGDGAAFQGAERWVRTVREYARARALTVAGSPKLGIYGVDFGWGRPRKVELVSTETTGAMSLAESRDDDGGIEVGITLPARDMEKFIDVFAAGLVGGESEGFSGSDWRGLG